MKPNFTPGPWFARKTGGLCLDQFVCNSDHECIANMDSGGGSFTIDEVDQNAHLIAAAPEMYEALEMVMKAWADLGKPDYDEIDRVLKKARGEK